jgi:hypothetical protein
MMDVLSIQSSEATDISFCCSRRYKEVHRRWSEGLVFVATRASAPTLLQVDGWDIKDW